MCSNESRDATQNPMPSGAFRIEVREYFEVRHDTCYPDTEYPDEVDKSLSETVPSTVEGLPLPPPRATKRKHSRINPLDNQWHAGKAGASQIVLAPPGKHKASDLSSAPREPPPVKKTSKAKASITVPPDSRITRSMANLIHQTRQNMDSQGIPFEQLCSNRAASSSSGQGDEHPHESSAGGGQIFVHVAKSPITPDGSPPFDAPVTDAELLEVNEHLLPFDPGPPVQPGWYAAANWYAGWAGMQPPTEPAVVNETSLPPSAQELMNMNFEFAVRNIFRKGWRVLLEDLATTCREWLRLYDKLNLRTRYGLTTYGRVLKNMHEKPIAGVLTPQNLTRNPYVSETGWFNQGKPIPRGMVRLYGDKRLEKASRALSIQLQHDFDTFTEIRGSVIAGVRQINVDVRSGSNYTWTTFDLGLPDGSQGECVVIQDSLQDFLQARRHGVSDPYLMHTMLPVTPVPRAHDPAMAMVTRYLNRRNGLPPTVSTSPEPSEWADDADWINDDSDEPEPELGPMHARSSSSMLSHALWSETDVEMDLT